MRWRSCRIVGDGPACLYLAIELARSGLGFDIEVCAQRDDSGVGVVLDEEFVSLLASRDPPSGDRIRTACQIWQEVRIKYRGDELVTGGHRIHGLSRRALVEILRTRAAGLGVTFRGPAGAQAGGCDILVAADGAGSRIRGSRAGQHGVTITSSRSEFLWMSTACTVSPGFWLAEAGGGVVIGHAYPFGRCRSAVVVECLPEVGQAAGLRDHDRATVEARVSALFAGHVAGGRLTAETFPWRPFRTVASRHWSVASQVLIGDAAHTTHYSVGSGTRLAVEDAISLAAALTAAVPVTAARLAEAFRAYQREREPIATAVQVDAHSSQLWFDDISRHVRLPADQMAFALRCRREVNTFGWLARRDPPFAARVMLALARDPRCPASPPGAAAVREPRLLPLRLGHLTLTSRVIRAGAVRHLPPGPLPVTIGPVPRVPGVDDAASGALLTPAGQAGAAGVIVGPPVRPADLRAAIAAADFLVVPAAETGQRIERTRLAERLRNTCQRTVFLWAAGLSEDEANTLIAAGRIDGYVIDAPPPASDGSWTPG